MNKITKVAVGTSIFALALLLIVIISGVSYPHPLFSYGTAFGLLFILVSLILYAVGWGRDFSKAARQKNYVGMLILAIAAMVYVLPFLKRIFFE